MNLDDFKKEIAAKMDEIVLYRNEKLPGVVGDLAVHHYKNSFINEGFTDTTLEKWPEVERRKPDSPWYGFKLNVKNNFSETRAVDKILSGETKDLQQSITSEKSPGRVTVGTDRIHAAVHQFGQNAKVFGKTTFKMKARPFIGKSEVLNQAIREKMERDLERIFKQ
jgi:phage gpG-like protein